MPSPMRNASHVVHAQADLSYSYFLAKTTTTEAPSPRVGSLEPEKGDDTTHVHTLRALLGRCFGQSITMLFPVYRWPTP